MRLPVAPPFKMWTSAGSEAAFLVHAERFKKLMSLSAHARKNYLQAKGWKYVGYEPFELNNKPMVRLYYYNEKLNCREYQTSAIRRQLWLDMEEEKLVLHEEPR
jgi:hypothetical protein